MRYEVQILGVTERPVAKWQKSLTRSMKKNRRMRREIVELFQRRGEALCFVNDGGSGSIEFTANDDEVTELTIDSTFYFPALFSRYDHLPLE